MARRLCQFILEIFSLHTISSSFLYFTCDLLFGVVPVFLWLYYSCSSSGSPSGSLKNVIFFPVNSSIRIGSQGIPSASSSFTVASTSSTLNARCRRPQASGLLTLTGGLDTPKISSSILPHCKSSFQSFLSGR